MGKEMINISLKQGEAKALKFNVQADGAAMNLSGATLFLGIKSSKGDATYLLFKDDSQFDKTQAALGITSVFMDATILAPGTYVGELKIQFLDGSIDKSDDLNFMVEQAVTN
jgi:hypothetical protein